MANPSSRADQLQQNAEAEEEADKKNKGALGAKRKFDEFECPVCSAYNPHEFFGNEDEVNCAYCGLPFVAVVNEDGRLKLREN
jgi:hypothetical protein